MKEYVTFICLMACLACTLGLLYTVLKYSPALPRRKEGSSFMGLLNYALPVGARFIAGKNGTLSACYELTLRDLSLKTLEERDLLRQRVAQAIAHFSRGWALQLDACTAQTDIYAAVSYKGPLLGAKIEELRQDALRRHPALERRFFLTITQQQDKRGLKKLGALVNGLLSKEDEQALAQEFSDRLREFEQALSLVYGLKKLARYEKDGREFHAAAEFLNFAVTGREHPVALGPEPAYLDSILGSRDFATGLCPRLGEEYLCLVAVDGMPSAVTAEILNSLTALSFPARFSTRYICLGSQAVMGKLKSRKRQWSQQEHGLISQLTDTTDSVPVNENAADQVDDLREAVRCLQSGELIFGEYCADIVLRNRDLKALKNMAEQVIRIIEDCGFGARIETVNSAEAFLGSLPTHLERNVRRHLISSQMLSCLLPLEAAGTGERESPNPLYGEKAPPLLQGALRTGEPFFLNLHDKDLGNTLVAGPPGAGKSVFLNKLMQSYLRYEGMQIFEFDRGCSSYALTLTLGGSHVSFDHGKASLCPLYSLDTGADLDFACAYIRRLCELNQVSLSPEEGAEVQKAVKALAALPQAQHTLSCLRSFMPSERLRDALLPYVSDGRKVSLIDGTGNAAFSAGLNVFECAGLFEESPMVRESVLLTVFRQIEKALDGSHPGLIVLDEAWLMLQDPQFCAYLLKMFKTLRKYNAAVVLCTQSLADFKHCGMFENLLDCAKTRIFLPNADAMSPHQRALYAEMGLMERQIEEIRTGRPKHDYFMQKAGNFACFDLCLTKEELRVMSIAGEQNIEKVNKALQKFGRGYYLGSKESA